MTFQPCETLDASGAAGSYVQNRSFRAVPRSLPVQAVRPCRAPRAILCKPRTCSARRFGLKVLAATALEFAPTSSSSWPSCDGEVVKVQQTQGRDSYQVNIQLTPDGISRVPEGTRVELHWGVYRADSSKWQHPQSIVPPDSYLDHESGGMRSPMLGQSHGPCSIALSIPKDLAPLTLAFAIYVSEGGGGGRGRYITPPAAPHFAVLVGMEPGQAEPLGVSRLGSDSPDGGTTLNFSLRSRGADKVTLVILKPPAPAGSEGGDKWGVLEVALDPWANRTGDTWHVAMSALRNLGGLVYGWRVEGDTAWETGNRFLTNQVMLDPHATLLAYLPLDTPCPLHLPTIPLQDGRRVAVLGTLAGLAAEQQRRRRQQEQQQQSENGGGPPTVVGASQGLPLEQLRLFELDVRSFSTGAQVQHSGQYLGVAEWIGHLRAVGANAVLLTPSYATAPGIGLLGRASVSFMAPDPQLSSDPANPLVAAEEFKAMVAQLHKQGIEVLMQVDLTFTAEGTDAEPNTISFRGLDHAIYYRPNANGVLNCGHVVVREYILNTLRHWALEYGVDGFCFLNAENLAQDRDGLVLDAPPLADALVLDPLLSSLKLIAYPSDEMLLPRSGARGFPHWGLWLQRNTAFTRDMHAFMLEGTSGLASAIATRLTGSPDIFTAQWDSGMPGDLAAGRRPAFGVNSASSLGHKPLQSLAAEAAAMVPPVRGIAAGPSPAATAIVVAKSLLLAAILGQGVPAVSQDVTADVELARFVGVLMRLRRRLRPLLLPPLFDSPRDIKWHGAAASREPDWDGSEALTNVPGANYIAFSVRAQDGSAVYLGINPHSGPVQAALPPPPLGMMWMRLVDTGLEAPDDATLEAGAPVAPTLGGTSYRVAPKAAFLLVAAPKPQAASAPAAKAA